MNTKSWRNLLLACSLALLSTASMADLYWPEEGDWIPLMQGAGFYSDDRGDQNPASVDLIGTTNIYSAGYWAHVQDGHDANGTLDDLFLLRLRMGGEGGNYVWQAHLDTDGDASNVEWIYQLVQSGNPEDYGVMLVKTSVGGATLQDVDIGGNTTAWKGDAAVYARWSQVFGTGDYHIDLAIPWSEFRSATGVSEINQIRIVLSTSTSHSSITKDAPIGASLTEQISNVLSENIPEPAVATLMIAAGGGLIAFRRLFPTRGKHEAD